MGKGLIIQNYAVFIIVKNIKRPIENFSLPLEGEAHMILPGL